MRRFHTILVIIYFYNNYIRNYRKQYWANEANTEEEIVNEVQIETLSFPFHII